MATPSTCEPAAPSAFALLNVADAAALMTTHRDRLAQIAAVAESAVDAAITEHFAERDRLEAAAHAALLARLAEQRLELRRLEAELGALAHRAHPLAAALPAATPSAISSAIPSAPRKRVDAKEPVMSDTKTRVSIDGQPFAASQATTDAACATIVAPQAGAAAAGVGVGVGEETAIVATVDAAARHRKAEAAYLSRTHGRRTEHAAALSELAEIEARIAALRASRSSSQAVRGAD